MAERAVNRIMPIEHAVALTDATAYTWPTRPPRAIWVGVTGDLIITTPTGAELTLKNPVAGMWHPVSLAGISASSTTTDMVVGW